MIPGFTMRVRVTNRKALLAWFAGQPGETGNHGAAKGRRAVFHMCGGCTGGSIPSCPTRALRFSKLPTAWEPSRNERATKNRASQPSFQRFRHDLRIRAGEVNRVFMGYRTIAMRQSGSEQRLTARTDGCAAGSRPSVASRTEHRPIATATRRRATPHSPARRGREACPD